MATAISYFLFSTASRSAARGGRIKPSINSHSPLPREKLSISSHHRNYFPAFCGAIPRRKTSTLREITQFTSSSITFQRVFLLLLLVSLCPFRFLILSKKICSKKSNFKCMIWPKNPMDSYFRKHIISYFRKHIISTFSIL